MTGTNYYLRHPRRTAPIALIVLLTIATGCKHTATMKSVAVPLQGTTWVLSEVNGVPLITPADARAVHFVLEKSRDGNQLHGYAGCNNVTGSYALSGKSSISFTVASTRMMCPADKMEVEQFFLDALTQADAYSLKDQTLLLMNGVTVLAKFTGSIH